MEKTSYYELENKYELLYKANKEIVDSMYYAEFVQQGILPQERHLNKLFEDYFVIYKPQGIIGGDLFWAGQKDEFKIFGVGDCTGHGISGALLSVLALSFLNYLVLGKNFNAIGEVLDELDKKWIETFHQGTELGYNNDWMEIGLVMFDPATRILQYTGAFNKLVYVHAGEIYSLAGNKFPVGGWQMEKQRSFNTHTVILPENSSLYLFSDGFKDQFGGISKKRFGSNRFNELIKRMSALKMTEQKYLFENEFSYWKKEEEQTDDICVLGIRL